MEDTQVGGRELHATTVRNRGTRTTAMAVQVDRGRARAARTTWSEKTQFVEIEPKSQPELADQPAALNELFRQFPGQNPSDAGWL